MEVDTPLVEVARFLSVAAAELLLEESALTQEYVLQVVRAQIVAYEEQGMLLDPIRLQELSGRTVFAELALIRRGRTTHG